MINLFIQQMTITCCFTKGSLHFIESKFTVIEIAIVDVTVI